jgi:hypothetical protein
LDLNKTTVLESMPTSMIDSPTAAPSTPALFQRFIGLPNTISGLMRLWVTISHRGFTCIYHTEL